MSSASSKSSDLMIHKKVALLVSIEYYATMNYLMGQHSGTTEWGKRLKNRFGFICHYLRDKLATIEGVEAKWVELTNGLVAGDSFVFVFSGHGGRWQDYDGDEENGVDETRWLYGDFNWPDDKLRALIGGIPLGVKITVILDSCYSGTGTRTPDMPPPPPYVVRRNRGLDEEKMREIVFSATDASNQGWTSSVGGLFSRACLRDLDALVGHPTARQLYDRMIAKGTTGYGPWPYKNQFPQLEGPTDLKDSPVFV